MLDICVTFGAHSNIMLNAKKSLYVAVDRKKSNSLPSMMLGNLSLLWMQNLKYLRVNFNGNCTAETHCSAIRSKLYSVCNSVFQRCVSVSEIVRLQLVKSFCLPVLTYCIGAVMLSKYAMLYSSYAYVATLKSIDYNVAMTFILNNNNNNNNNVGMMHTGPCFIIKGISL